MRFRMSIDTKKRLIMVLDAIIVIGVIVAVLLGALIFKQSGENQEKTLHKIQTSATHTENAMACMGTFFSLTNRTNLRITDNQKCIIVNIKDGKHHTLDTDQFRGQTAQPSSPSTVTKSATPATVSGRQNPTSPPSSTPATPPAQQPQASQPGPVRSIINGVTKTVKSLL